MAQPLDPYRTLGLTPGASADEIRRAYRKLAKANHPDSAGEAALPRFLAIQAAYELLMEGRARPTARRATGRAPQQPPAQPSPADRSRARATRDSYARSRRGAGRGSASGAGTTGAAGNAGTTPSGGDASAGPGSETGGTSEKARRGGRPRAPNKATLGSTSYDAAEDEPFEPDWSGGTWYGASSGTYWTINPKEYADPRKHGPEYQARARRRLDGVEYDPADDDPEISGEDFAGAESETATGSERRGFDGRWAYPDDGGNATRVDDAAQSAGWDWQDELLTPEPRPSMGDIADRLLAGNVGLGGRMLLAFLGWLPIASLIGGIAGEVSGCGRFTASCVDPNGLWVIVPNVVILTLLVALPQVAAISAAGAIGTLALSVPTAVILSAAGGAHEPAAASAIITAASIVGYVAGAAFATGRRLGWRRVP